MPASATILNKPMSPVRCTCTPPHNSMLEPMFSTRTLSPYFSPNNIMAPVALAASMSITRALACALSKISALTLASIAVICASVTGALCAKSKRVRSALTKLPFCCTCSPSTSRRALCIKCVALWLRMVLARMSMLTCADTVSPTFKLPDVSTPWWPNTSALIFCVSCTSNTLPLALMTPSSPTCPPLSA